jgi:hypothetical protein
VSARKRISDDNSAGGIQAAGSGRRGVGMDSLREMLDTVRERDELRGRFRGLLHILVGRRITRADDSLVSAGMTWRDAAGLLKRLRWDREAVRELGLDPAVLPPRDRERYWYTAIARAGIDSPEAIAEAEHLLSFFKQLDYLIGPAPGGK